jgi:hypothetical protein
MARFSLIGGSDFMRPTLRATARITADEPSSFAAVAARQLNVQILVDRGAADAELSDMGF